MWSKHLLLHQTIPNVVVLTPTRPELTHLSTMLAHKLTLAHMSPIDASLAPLEPPKPIQIATRPCLVVLLSCVLPSPKNEAW